MGKHNKYYCDFCGKVCPNSKFYKTSHALSLQHVYNKNKYYEQFIGDRAKCVVTCPHAMKFRSCKYGPRCNLAFLVQREASGQGRNEEYDV